MSEYWSTRFKEGGMIWGTEPSPTAAAAAKLFKRHGAAKILVPGAGYGRNSKALSSDDAGFQVEAIELSGEAVELAREWDSKTLYHQGSILEASVTDGQRYEGIYAYDVLHLFRQEERALLIRNCREWLSGKGVVYVTCFSDEDSHYGQGRLIEPGTYEYMPDKYAHFFSEQDLLAHFSAFDVLETGSVEETLRYTENREKHYKLRYLAAQKK